MSTSTQITTQEAPRTLKGLINSEAMKTQFALALPKHLSPERFARIAITALTRTPKLQECTQESVMKCLLDLSAMGLEPDGRRAYLIPYGKECTLITSYMGLVELVRRSGDVTSIRAEVVCEKDEFSWENGAIHHVVNWREDRGKMQAAYAVATLASGETQSAVMTLAEIEGIRKRSKSANSGPWVSDFSEMSKKTAVRRLIKMLPISSEIMERIEKGDEPLPPIRDVTPARAQPINPFAPLPEAKGAAEAPLEEQPDAEWGEPEAEAK